MQLLGLRLDERVPASRESAVQKMLKGLQIVCEAAGSKKYTIRNVAAADAAYTFCDQNRDSRMTRVDECAALLLTPYLLPVLPVLSPKPCADLASA